MERIQNDRNRGENIVIYGGVEISENERKILSKEPGYMVYSGIDELELEVEIEKGIAKARYELMSRGDEDAEEAGGEENEADRQEVNPSKREGELNKVLQYSNMRATDIPTVQRLHEPKQGSVRQEVVMESTKEKLLECVVKYKAEKCNEKGELKDHNLDREERKGLKELKNDVKEKKLVIFTTDKSGKFSVDSPENYGEAIRQHTTKDIEIEGDEKIKQVENKINLHMK